MSKTIAAIAQLTWEIFPSDWVSFGGWGDHPDRRCTTLVAQCHGKPDTTLNSCLCTLDFSPAVACRDRVSAGGRQGHGNRLCCSVSFVPIDLSRLSEYLYVYVLRSWAHIR